MAELAENGAASFVVPNMFGPLNDTTAPFLGNYEDHNDRLSTEMARLRDELDVAIYETDFADVVVQIIEDPSSYGLVETVESACSDCGKGDNPNASQVAENPEGFFLFDDIHPGSTVHRAFGEEAFQSLSIEGDFHRNGALDAQDIDALSLVVRAAGCS